MPSVNSDKITPPVVPGPTVQDWLKTPEEEEKDPAFQTEFPYVGLPSDHTRPGGNNYRGGRG